MNKKVAAGVSSALIAGLAVTFYFVVDRSGSRGASREIERTTTFRVGGEEWARLELDLQTNWHLSTSPDADPTPVTLPDIHKAERLPDSDGPPPPPPPRKRAIYRTKFTLVDLPVRASCARIQITGAISGGTVRLNNQSVGKSNHPDLPFYVEATKALRRSGPNLLELDLMDWEALKIPGLLRPVGKVTDFGPKDLHHFFRRAGLAGPVRLQLSGNPRVEKVRITPSVSRQTVRVDATLASCTGKKVAAKVRFQIFSPEGEAGPVQEKEVTVGPSGVKLSAELPGAELKRWGTPPHGSNTLYTVVVTVSSPSEVVDQTSERFGYREVRIGREGFLLNDMPLLLSAKRFGIQLHNLRDVSEMLSARTFHGINSLALHQGSTQHEPFDLADELGGYHVPGLVCIGGLNPEFHKWSANARAWLTSYHRAWLDALHNHPSIVMWGQESFKKVFQGLAKLKLDRPALDVDIRGLQGSYSELLEMKERLIQSAKAGTMPGLPVPTGFSSNLMWIQEIHRALGKENIAKLLSDFPRMVGLSLSRYNEKVGSDWSKKYLYNGHALPRSSSLIKILPELIITAPKGGTFFVRRCPAAAQHLYGIALEAAERGRLPMGGPGEVTLLKNARNGPQKSKVLNVKRAPAKKARPAMTTTF